MTCNAVNSQLLIIDMQQKLGAVMPEKVLARVVRNAGLLLSAAGLLNVPTVFSEQYPKGLGPTDPRLRSLLPKNAIRLEKTCFSCVDADGFRQVGSNPSRPQVVIAGMECHICVLQTALDMLVNGMQPFVVEDAVCSRRLENYENALSRLRQAGVIVATAESIVFEWVRDASHEQFRTISALVR